MQADFDAAKPMLRLPEPLSTVPLRHSTKELTGMVEDCTRPPQYRFSATTRCIEL